MRFERLPDLSRIRPDPAVDLDRLLGPDAGSVIASFLGAAPGSVRAAGATYRPGRSLLVRYRTGAPAGEVVLGVGRLAPVGSEVADGVVGWRAADDPWLPGLRHAVYEGGAARLLDEMGLAGPGPISVQRRAYRPTRRAVVEVSQGPKRVFLKVVRPEQAARLADVHVHLSAVAPVPTVVGLWPQLGIVALRSVEGRTVREVLRTTGPLPKGRALTELLSSLPDPQPSIRVASGAAESGWRAVEHGRHLSALLPDWARRVDELAGSLAEAGERAQRDPVVAVHGDFYEAQVIMRGDRIGGLVDVDTFGWGRRVDDLGAYLGHLEILAMVSPRHAERILAHQRRLLVDLDRMVDPSLLRARVAAAVLGLATGPFRVLDRHWAARTESRIERAERWLAAARL